MSRDEPGEAAEPEECAASEDDEPTPRLKVVKGADGRKQLYELGPDGEWLAMENPPVSNDPNVNAIGDLDIEEYEKVLNDEDDPRYELAKEYSKRWSERMMRSLSGITDQYSALVKNIIGSSTAFERMKAMPSPPAPIVPKSVRERQIALDAHDFNVELPHNPMHEVLDEQRTMSSAIVETNGHLAEMVEQAKKDASSSEAQAAEERRRARWALGAAWAAVAMTVAFGIIQIAQN